MSEIRSPVTGTVAAAPACVGDLVEAGTTLVVVESMKMEYPVAAEGAGRVASVTVGPGDDVRRGQLLVEVDDLPVGEERPPGSEEPPSPDRPRANDELRPELAEVLARHERTTDAARPGSVRRRRERGQRTARESVGDLLDAGSFVEYGPLVVAAQRSRRDLEDLIDRTPADGLVAGIGTVDGTRTVVLAYDATVLAGTQGHVNHRKLDRLLDVAARERLPVVLFAEGGGGRPGDTDVPVVSGLDVPGFGLFARLSGSVPLVGIASGRCFAGNAALLGCCDVIIATTDSTIGMGGPAMIDGAGLGAVTPEEVGPIEVQSANGVVDLVAEDEAAAVRLAGRYLALVARPPGSELHPDHPAPDPLRARDVVPPGRRTVYDVHAAIDALVDEGSALELRGGWAPGMVTALATVEGRPLGIVANNPLHLAGAIDSDGADKAARFLQLCDAHGLAVLFLCDTPGFMVGPEAERTATVRHVSRMFVVGARLTVPFGTIILRKAYGHGAMAMAGGSFRSPLFCVSWPTGELGGMGLEGAVRLGFRDELDAVEDPAERVALYDRMVAAAYDNGRALNTATIFEIDDVIDPAASRRWITTLLTRDGRPPGRGRGFVDTW